MEAWLERETAASRQTLSLIQGLTDQGFRPVPTAPTREAEVRRDHTLAIIEVLASWAPSAFRYPLKVFSSGPVYERGHWAESLDVEVLEDGAARIHSAEAVIFDLLRHLVETRPAGADALVLVVGHREIMRRLLAAAGADEDTSRAVWTAFGQGDWTAGVSALARLDPDLVPLVRPTGPHEAASTLHMLSDRYPDAGLKPFIGELSLTLDHLPAVRWDLSLTGSWPYYSGLLFALYERGQGEALVKGGRFTVHYQERAWHGSGFTIMLPSWFGGEARRGGQL